MRKIHKSILLLCKEQKGAVKIIVALSMFMLIGFTAFVVDVGSLYFEKSSLQKSLDAAVLGGAQLLMVSGEEAREVAMDLADQNGFEVTEDEVDTGENFIEINKIVSKDLFFARVLGFEIAEVGAAARAEIHGSLKIANGVIPVGMPKDEYQKGISYAMNKTPGYGDSGNYQFLGIDGTGMPPLLWGIENGSRNTVEVRQLVKIESGGGWNNVIEAFEKRIKRDNEKSYCAVYGEADYSCNRVVIVPMTLPDPDGNGQKVIVVGFAAFWIEDVVGKEKGNGKGSHDDKEVRGRFIEIFTEGTFGASEEDYGIYGVKLVK